jgi:Na+/H+ antiporter NhaD/arsenite permease-like protein
MKFGGKKTVKVGRVGLLVLAVAALIALGGRGWAQEHAQPPAGHEQPAEHGNEGAHEGAPEGAHEGHGEAVDPAQAQKELADKLGTKVEVMMMPVAGEPGAGTIIIEYASPEDLDRIVSVILGGKKDQPRKELMEFMSKSLGSSVDITDPAGADKKITISFGSLGQLAGLQNKITSWKPPLWSVTGFVLMLLSIAVIPLVKGHWWEHNKNRAIVSAILGVPLAIFVIINDWQALIFTFHEYEQFIILLGALFVISGGILLTGDVQATPGNNTIFLAIGGLMASFIGTTGAAMLLIRPLLTTNQERKYVVHTVIFFIFIVANIGGSLTPLGDPPLFLGYLKGVPFTWTLRLWHIWLPTVLWLLALYFAIDTYIYNKKESAEAKIWDITDIKPLRLQGYHNFALLLGVVLSIYFYPDMVKIMEGPLGISPHVAEFIPVREFIMLAMAAISWKTTKMELRKAQNFTWGPILEVAILFSAIFVTMIPALIILRNWGPTSPIRDPWHFFWVTGALSSFLDNAPTYLVFLSLGEGQGVSGSDAFVQLFSGGKVKEVTLMAISAGAVFMGSNTYIGNAPNFMVKSIAEENKIKMPSFFGYMAWSIGILIPTFIIITLIFFRG